MNNVSETVQWVQITQIQKLRKNINVIKGLKAKCLVGAGGCQRREGNTRTKSNYRKSKSDQNIVR